MSRTLRRVGATALMAAGLVVAPDVRILARAAGKPTPASEEALAKAVGAAR
jgi:hypothetical protein